MALISFLSTLHPCSGLWDEYRYDLIIVFLSVGLHDWQTHTHIQRNTSIRAVKNKTERIVSAHLRQTKRSQADAVFLTDSAFGAASAQGQLKGVRPCQSIQECWETAAYVCEGVFAGLCVCVRGSGGARWAVSWPEPRPDFINQGRKRVQPLKAWPKDFARCLPCDVCFSVSLLPFPQLVLSASFSSSLSISPSLSGCPPPRRLSVCASHTRSADKSALRAHQIAAQGFQNNTSSSRLLLLVVEVVVEGLWKVVMIYSIIPVETQELLCVHDSSVSSPHYVATDGWMPGPPASPLKELVVAARRG